MGWLLLILVSHVAGIVWADRAGCWPTPSGVVANGAASSLALGLALVLGVDDRSRESPAGLARHRGPLRRGARRVAIPVLALASASSGHAGLARALELARIGAERAEALDPATILRIDARVLARRPTRFGDEVVLGAVRARRGEAAVPERLLLMLTPPDAGGPRSTSADRRVRADVQAGGGEAATQASRAERVLFPGAEVRLAVRVGPLLPSRNPGSSDRAHAWARRGVGARARLPKDDWVVERLAGPGLVARLAAAATDLRRDGSERIRTRLEPLGDGQGLVRALALGDRRGLSEATQDDFRRLGLTHLLSVSGLHIGFVAWPAAWLVHRLRVRLRGAAPRPIGGFLPPLVAASLAGGCYAWLTGAEVPAVRSSLLFVLFAASRSLGWRIAPAPALVATALLLLAADAAILFDLGAQLSFGACAALVVGGVPGRTAENADGAGDDPAAPTPGVGLSPRGALAAADRLARAGGGMVVDAVRTSLVVSLGMLPLVELLGLPRALPSPVVNALAIPWTGFVVMPCALGAALMAVLLPGAHDAPGSSDASVVDSVATIVVERLLLPAAGFEQIAATLSTALPSEAMDDDRPGRIPWSAGIGAIAFALRGLRRGALGPAAMIWTALAGLGFAPWPESGFESTRPRIVFFDVGQADAALVETASARWLVDAGPGPEDGSGGSALVGALRAEGIRRLDVLVLTHGDLDHRGGALRVLSAVNVGELWLPRLVHPDPALERIADFAATRGVPVRRVASGDPSWVGGGLRVDVLWPPSVDPPGRPASLSSGRGRNERSLVLRMELTGFRALFMADVGGEVEAELRRTRPEALRSEVLKVGHHGSRRSSTTDFLAAVAPRIVVVSAPCQGARGLPSVESLRRLRGAGAGLGWTGRDGAVLVSARGAEPPTMRYWGTPRRCASGFERAPSSPGPIGDARDRAEE